MTEKLPDGFVLDNSLPPGFVPDAPPTKVRKILSGVNRGYAQTLGMPVDLAAAMLNYSAPGYKPMVETPIENPVLGSQMIKQGGEAAGIDFNQPRDFWGMLGEYGAFVPFIGPYNAVASPASGPLARFATRTLGEKVGPVVGQTAREAVAATAAAAGGAAGQQVAERVGSDSPFFEMAGAVVPAALASGASGIPKWLTRSGDPSLMKERIAQFEAQNIPYTRALATGDAGQLADEAKLAANPGAYEVFRGVGRQADEAFGASTQKIAGGGNSSVDAAGTVMNTGGAQGGGLFGRGGWYDRFKAKSGSLYSALDAKIGGRTPVISPSTDAYFSQYMKGDPSAPALSAGEKNSLIIGMAEDYKADTTANLGQLPYERLKNLRTRVGKALEINDTTVLGSSDRAALKGLYEAISKDMEAAARVSGASTEFALANRFYRQGAERADVWLDNLSKKVKPEDFWRATVGDSPKSATQLRAYKQMLKPDEWDFMVETTMNRWGKIQPGQETIAHDFALNKWYTNWNATPDEVRTVLLGKKGTPKRDAAELMAKNMDAYRESNQVLFNSSGTAALGLGASAQFGAAGGVGTAVIGYLTGMTQTPTEMMAAMAAGTYGGVKSAAFLQAQQAKLVTNQKFVKWLSQGMKMPADRLPGHLLRLASIANKDKELEEPAKEIIRGLDPALYEKLYQ